MFSLIRKKQKFNSGEPTQAQLDRATNKVLENNDKFAKQQRHSWQAQLLQTPIQKSPSVFANIGAADGIVP